MKLNTGAVYSIFGSDIHAFYEEYITSRNNPFERARMDSVKAMLDLNRQKGWYNEQKESCVAAIL